MPDEEINLTPADGDMPMLFKHSVTVFKKMEETATYDDVADIVVWEGVLTTLITQECHLSLPSYTSITRVLKGLGCIRQLRRGGGTSPSQWEIIKAPEAEEYNKLMVDGSAKNAGRPSRTAMLEQQVRELTDKVSKVELAVVSLIEFIEKQGE